MAAASANRGSGLEKWSLVALSVLGAVLIGAAILSLVRVFSNPADETADRRAAPADAATNAALTDEELERQYAESHPPPPVIIKPIATPAVVTATNQTNAAIILQQEKVKVNQQLINRLKRYVQEHPNLDTHELEAQIKKREEQSASVP